MANGELPEGREKVPLGARRIASIVMGQSPSSASYNTEGVGLPFFQGKADFGMKHPTPTKWCTAPSKVAETGDVLISVRAPVGDVNIATEQCCIGRGIAAIQHGSDADSEFLFYSLMREKERLAGLGTGAIFGSITKNVLYDFELDIPPLLEQRAIASVLSKLQGAVEVQDRIIATMKELKAATLAKLFREGLRGEPLKETEVGEIPENWEVEKIEDLGEIVTGTTPPTSDRTSYGGEIPFIAPGDLGEFRMVRRAQKTLSESGLKRSRVIPSGAVLVVCIGSTIGKVGMTEAPAGATNQQINAIICREGLKPEFVHYLMLWNAARIANMATPSPVPILSKGSFEDIAVAIPSDDQEANEIAKTLCAIDDLMEAQTNTRNTAEHLFQSMLHLLMTGQVRVSEVQSREREG